MLKSHEIFVRETKGKLELKPECLNILKVSGEFEPELIGGKPTNASLKRNEDLQSLLRLSGEDFDIKFNSIISKPMYSKSIEDILIDCENFELLSQNVRKQIGEGENERAKKLLETLLKSITEHHAREKYSHKLLDIILGLFYSELPLELSCKIIVAINEFDITDFSNVNKDRIRDTFFYMNTRDFSNLLDNISYVKSFALVAVTSFRFGIVGASPRPVNILTTKMLELFNAGILKPSIFPEPGIAKELGSVLSELSSFKSPFVLDYFEMLNVFGAVKVREEINDKLRPYT